MDSLTQATLGAAVGEAVLGKKLGNKAVYLGAAAGTLSDLDVIPGMLFDTPGRLLFHRGFSHSFVFVILATMLFAWLFSKFFTRNEISRKEWLLYFGLIFTASVLIDSFTTYGTQLFWPLEYRFEFNTMFVVDPMFTLPMLITVIWLLFKPKGSAIRKRLSHIGLIVAGSYLMLSIVNKQLVNSIFRDELNRQGISYSRMTTNPGPMNQILWTALAETEDGYWTGYYSHFDEDKNVAFQFFPKKHELLDSLRTDPGVKEILRFTKGFYTVEPIDGGFFVNDLRFGKIKNWKTGKRNFVFRYIIRTSTTPVRIDQAEQSFEGSSEILAQLWQRIFGKKDF